MRNRAIIITAVLGALALALLTWRLTVAVSRTGPDDVDTQAGVAYLQELEQADAAAGENELRSQREQQAGSTRAAQTTNALQGGNFQAAFRDTVFAGDSLVKALSEYHVLGTSQVFAEVNASTKHLTEVTGSVVAAHPKYLVLHYGENALDKMERAPYFVKNYKECIATLQERLPNTVIFVDSIWPVMDKAHKSEPYTVNIDQYNVLLRQMAKELGVIYLDYDPLFRSFRENYYDPDGIHPKYSFYTEQYLPFVYSEVQKH